MLLIIVAKLTWYIPDYVGAVDALTYLSASLKFVRSKVEKLLLLTYEKITIYRIPNYLHSFPA